jgi:putative acetyltransferase
MIVREVDWADAAGESLRTAQRAELAIRYGTPDSEPGPAPTAADITVFFIAYGDDDDPLGCGGLRRLSDSEGEIKRMYVRPESRGTGVSTAVLRTLEDYARALGWQRLVLETGEEQPDAIRFYEREGYSRIPNFGYYVDSPISLCFAKTL